VTIALAAIAAVLAITLYVIVDLEYPRLGLFRIAEGAVPCEEPRAAVAAPSFPAVAAAVALPSVAAAPSLR